MALTQLQIQCERCFKELERGKVRRGMCHYCYDFLRRRGKLDGLSGQQCSVEGCEATVFGSDMCGAHYSRLRRKGDVMADRPVNGRGADVSFGSITEDGYRTVRLKKVI